MWATKVHSSVMMKTYRQNKKHGANAQIAKGPDEAKLKVKKVNMYEYYLMVWNDTIYFEWPCLKGIEP